MKVFDISFFEASNFVNHTTQFDYLPVQQENEACHICYNVNDNFISIMGASIVSILENNKDMHFIFHIFTDGCSEDNRDKIDELSKAYQCRCIIYELNMEPFLDFHIKVSRFSRITYARLCMPKVLAKVTDRFIYVDADTMCVRSIKDLWNLNMEGYAVGAVSEKEDAVTYRVKFLKLQNGKYFNDGVMIVDIPNWENSRITEKSFSYQNEPPERFLGQSQDILNIVFDGNIYFLPAAYNMYGGGSRDKGDSIFVHWTGRRKPWQMVLTPFDEQWRKYNALSPWETLTNILPVKKPENYHDFQQWGRYQKSKGDTRGWLKGLFWYAVLRIRYKCKI